ncbi:MAG TPA: cupin domain-containing protein [Kofleriaceae bacterium]
MERTFSNPVTGDTATLIEMSKETSGVRSVAEIEVKPGGGVPMHQHADHDELIEVATGEVEVIMNGKTRRLGAGERIFIERGVTHLWRNPSPDRGLTMRATMTPGHPDFERFLRVYYGLGRDGELGKNKMPKRFSDLALLAELDPSIFIGLKRLLRPLMRWVAKRARTRGREAELLRRYVPDDVR